MSCHIGIDPGFTGAWAQLGGYFSGSDGSFVADLETLGEKAQKRLDVTALFHRMTRQERPGLVVAIERAHTMPKQGIASQGRYMAAYGALVAAADLANAKILLPTAGQWKRSMGLISKGLTTAEKKEAAREMAIRLFPELRDQLTRKKDHNRAEALLLAEWARRQK